MSVDVTKYLGTIRRTVDHYAQYAPWWMRLELRQQVAVILLEYPKDKLEDAESKGLVPALVSRIVRNQWCSRSSEFHRRWRRMDEVGDEWVWDDLLEPTEQEEPFEDDTVLLIKRIVAELPPKVKESLLLYADYGNFVEPAELLGVYPTTVRDRVNKARKLIKKKLKEWEEKE